MNFNKTSKKKIKIPGFIKTILILENEPMLGEVVYWNYYERYGWIVPIKNLCSYFKKNIVYMKQKYVIDDNLFLHESIIVQFILFQDDSGLGAMHIKRASRFLKNQILIDNQIKKKKNSLFTIEKQTFKNIKKNIFTIHLGINKYLIEAIKGKNNIILQSLKKTSCVDIIFNNSNFLHFGIDKQSIVTIRGNSKGLKIACQLIIQIISEISQSLNLRLIFYMSDIEINTLLWKKKYLNKYIGEKNNIKICFPYDREISNILPIKKCVLEGNLFGLYKSTEIIIDILVFFFIKK